MVGSETTAANAETTASSKFRRTATLQKIESLISPGTIGGDTSTKDYQTRQHMSPKNSALNRASSVMSATRSGKLLKSKASNIDLIHVNPA